MTAAAEVPVSCRLVGLWRLRVAARVAPFLPRRARIAVVLAAGRTVKVDVTIGGTTTRERLDVVARRVGWKVTPGPRCVP